MNSKQYDEEVRRRITIMEAYLDGAPMEIKGLDHNPDKWFPISGTKFDNWADYDYRVKPDEEPTPDTIDWSAVNERYRFMTRDADGIPQLHAMNPTVNRIPSMGYWIGDEGSIDARLFASYKQGDVSWDNSLVKRP